ncbi:nucleotide sugar dehydrogenase [Maribacter stanieri]|uniref:UDP-N-acetyl-D-galactosamine dehydrogenase n=1 Tax=Maribacter stanieri TaxID=440514 RepID=A0A1I6JST6_9FLAO|nr:nucleotide sugar dehydrogenase [Maribacter stanieri]SFR82003.1 UDP-N-acetyl-D-galactosamine dehydrogenase [Maribacter stanieri]|tara:strand:- start:1588 stop:2862 length:1275 start_codon:yes stop_codon:yes gene_type:complete
MKIGIIGLGYVGLPLAALFAKKYSVIGYDINIKRVQEINLGKDTTLELSDLDLDNVLKKTSNIDNYGLFCTANIDELKDCDFYIVTVPTPVDDTKRPVFTPLIKASETVGKVLKEGNIVIYESTVYPGATEEICVPELEKSSGLTFNKNFYVGYSPERINPGDKEHTVEKILKVTAGSTPETAKLVDDLYSSVITAGTHLAPTIKVAEASKVIENTQRDINIAFMNELAKIFHLLDIDTNDVLKAAGTKWNFLPFKPGLVGGHCIGVDPYYLAQKAQENGYNPDLILASRRINDGMGEYLSLQIIKLMLKHDLMVKDSKILIMGITFKEDCPDIRNTKVVDMIKSLNDYKVHTTIYDPWAEPQEVLKEYGITTTQEMPRDTYDVVISAVAHKKFQTINIADLLNVNGIIYDVKGTLPGKVHGRL